MKKHGKNGFTLIEVIVVSAVIAILAGILVPVIFNQIDEAKRTRALADCKSISSAVMMFRKDLGIWPYQFPDDCTQHYFTLESAGTNPVNDADDWQVGLNRVPLAVIFNLPAGQACYQNKNSLNYLAQDSPDPWENKYVINAANFAGIDPVWVISAGPNGCLDTTVNSPLLNNAPCSAGMPDDIGIRIK